ncbi:MAG: hypothetical protein FWD37_01785 [Methanomassiliicoccaceae archaeon]|nr:hypothetical protein [Methanomassiliicoccaceae archaeon]
MNGLKIICGHYGSGKTNFAINYAIDEARNGNDVTLVDMDLVNPYFTSSEYSDILKKNGINVISSAFACTNVESLALPALQMIFDSDDTVIIDAGGDDAGATALGRFSDMIKEKGYEMFYVTNMYRPFTSVPSDSADMMKDIEKACKLKATAIVNNSHLKEFTTVSTITDSVPYAKEVSEIAKIPLLFSTVPRNMINKLKENENFYPIDVYVTTVWEKGE